MPFLPSTQRKGTNTSPDLAGHARLIRKGHLGHILGAMGVPIHQPQSSRIHEVEETAQQFAKCRFRSGPNIRGEQFLAFTQLLIKEPPTQEIRQNCTE